MTTFLSEPMNVLMVFALIAAILILGTYLLLRHREDVFNLKMAEKGYEQTPVRMHSIGGNEYDEMAWRKSAWSGTMEENAQKARQAMERTATVIASSLEGPNPVIPEQLRPTYEARLVELRKCILTLPE